MPTDRPAASARPALFLGLETTCDETAAALVRRASADGPGEIASNVVWGQTDLHAAFGGVVPEIAARAHVERIDACIADALRLAGADWPDLDGVAVSAGPGLIGGVVAGVASAQAIAMARRLPLWGVNHLEGHALTPRLSHGLPTPYLLLLVSGGHCLLIAVDAPGAYRRLGGSIDDAPGEAFDKLAKHLGLGFPGGPEVERAAADGDAGRFSFPRPLSDRPTADMSFSGLKTAARLASDKLVAEQGGLSRRDVADICAAYQSAIAETLAAKTRIAARAFADAAGAGAPLRLAVAGGVAANATVRSALTSLAAELGFEVAIPPPALCTDNGAMIAWAGLERARIEPPPDPFAIVARPRWPLDADAAPMLGSGKRGPKA